ncbi:penicillin-binding protein 1B [Gynuella sunshinyii]|uniref:Penicillin-binding protein 1B n=1 Tax=Gynuella sunshinyii YC6258 TaxID=1445510 RepID=A0A0C5VGZ6_9GAMM|nr:penicillin-binding protein 1B [Gynuella sunshinyii]AJQ93887.1 membrane carboxypeptidase (penicillin-binding protein) [Gynuella sunshinyii YC6258]
MASNPRFNKTRNSTTRKPAKKASSRSSKPGRRSTPKTRKGKTGRRFSIFGLLLKVVIVLLALLICWTIYLNARVTTGFKGKLFAEPARVFARPLELYQGLTMAMGDLEQELRRLGYRKVINPVRSGEYSITGQTMEMVTRQFTHWDGVNPSQHLMLDFNHDGIERVVNNHGDPAVLARLQPLQIGSIYPGQKEDRILIQISDVPDVFVKGLISVEDRNYYHHFGISPTGILRALWANVSSGHLAQGGSTLTQQLVKNYFLSSERSLWRKGNEALMAMLLEWHYSKDQILEAYMNEVYLAQDGARAIHGFGLGAQEFFGAPLRELRLHQMALLIGMIKGPAVYNPMTHPERALERRNLVLDIMADQGVVTADQAGWAKKQPLDIRSGRQRIRYPAFLDMVRRQLQSLYRPEDLTSEGLKIYTSLDPRIQSRAEEVFIDQLQQLEKNYKLDNDFLQGALVITQPESGEVLAMVGGRRVRFDGYNRALDSRRPVGSLLKPVVYLTALENGYTLATPIDDNTLVVSGKDGSEWQPTNFDRRSHGQPLLLQALSHSYNQATARLGMQVGLGKFMANLHDLGFEREVDAYPATLLGAQGMSPLEVANLYGTFAANGFRTPVKSIRAVTTSDDSVLETFDFSFKQVVDPVDMELLQFALQDVMRDGTGKYAYRRLDPELNLAGKTGTTNDQRDSWFAGYTSDYLAVVWIGNDDNKMTPLTGSTGALRIWTEVMNAIKPQAYLSREPAGIEWQWVNAKDGHRTSKNCPDAIQIPFREGTAPQAKDGCAGQVTKPVQNWFKRWFGGKKN